MQVIPAIDLRNRECVRLVQGRKSEVTVYDGDPVAVAKRFALAGAKMIHVVDLDGAFNDGESTNRQVVKKIIDQVGVLVEFGGGVRTFADIEQLFEIGVKQVILGTVATDAPRVLTEFVATFPSAICVGIDARAGRVMIRGWEEESNVDAVDLAKTVAECGIERIIYTDISRDGMLTGPNLQQTLLVARSSHVHVTASGGVSSLDDIRRLRDSGEELLDSVIVGKALYEGRFTLDDALKVAGEPA